MSLAVRAVFAGFIREGPAFRRLLAELESHQSWDARAIHAYHEKALARVLRWCADVPYYSGRLAEWGLGSGPALDALARVPLLDKETLRLRNMEFRTRGWRNRFAHEGHTSGTTGKPIRCWRDGRSIVFENAALWRVFRWAGVSLSDRRALLRGDLVVPASRGEPPFWKLATPNQLYLSSYHLAPRHLGAYVEALRRFAPAAIQAYPSSAALVAAWLLECGETLPVKAVLTSSETLLDAQRDAIERAFCAPVIDYYGNAERTAMIARCEKGAYHVLWDYAVTEFLGTGDDGSEIVGTPLENRAMPLLRYRSGDRAERAPRGERCPCGRSFPVCGRPEGRRDLYILTPDGRRIGRMDHIFKGLRHIREAQIVQKAVDRIVLLAVTDPAFGEPERELLLRQTRERVGPGVSVTLEIVEAIPRGPGGKFAAIVSELRGADVAHEEIRP